MMSRKTCKCRQNLLRLRSEGSIEFELPQDLELRKPQENSSQTSTQRFSPYNLNQVSHQGQNRQMTTKPSSDQPVLAPTKNPKARNRNSNFSKNGANNVIS